MDEEDEVHKCRGFPRESACNTRDVVLSPGGEDPLERKMASNSSILAWEIPWTEEPGRLQSAALQKSNTT